MIKFTVHGFPKAKGSLSAFPYQKDGKTRVAMVQGKTSKDWEKLVRNESQRFAGGELLTHPLHVVLYFYLTKPQSRIRKNSVPYPYPNVKPDIDKLSRSVLDALTGIIFKDDAQIVSLFAYKNYGDPPRVEIEVREINSDSYPSRR